MIVLVAGGCGEAGTQRSDRSDSGAMDTRADASLDALSGDTSSSANDAGDDATDDESVDTAAAADQAQSDQAAQNDTHRTPDPSDQSMDVGSPSGDGCGQTPPATDTWSVVHDGLDRSFRVHLPPSYDPNVVMPVVLNYHGRNMTASQQALLSRMNETADANGFIVVYPEGTGSLEQTWNGGYCCGSAQAENVDDVGFTAAMLDELEANLCVDTDRVYAIGMSNGGFMSHRLGCDLADRITAIGAVAGTLGVFDCSPARPVPVIHFHGTDDSVVAYDGYFGQASAPGSVETWARLNGCSSGSSVYFEQDDVTCEHWTGCSQGAEVRFCTIEGGGHTWPGGDSTFTGFLGRTTQTISASDEFWTFVSGFSR